MSSRAASVIQLLTAYKEVKPSGSWGTSLTQGFNWCLLLKSASKQRENFFMHECFVLENDKEATLYCPALLSAVSFKFEIQTLC